MKRKGTCPITKETATIEFRVINCGTFDNPNACIKGLLDSCSVLGTAPCPYGKCPIYDKIPDELAL